MQDINVIGGGLAGSEAAYRIASQGIKVKLWEMRPHTMTPVHQSGGLSELVCSNSLKSDILNTAQGLLKNEMRCMDSLLLKCAEETRVPAGSALAVDRERFSARVSEEVEKCGDIEVIRQEKVEIPEDEITIIATGPLSSEKIYKNIQQLTGEEDLYFYDAVAPSITYESLNKDKIFKASRYGKGSADYYNCPMNKEEYEIFYNSLVNADVKEGHLIDKKLFFNSCMPIEVMARRGKDTLRFGPMKPVGLENPDTGYRAWAVVQLRQENKEGTVYGLVGFQTRLKWSEQKKILSLIPGLENAEFVRYGVMHRNTYINSPNVLLPTLQYNSNRKIFFAGQITGVEGYMESAATGILAGINAARLCLGKSPLVLPQTTMLGALMYFITSSGDNNFQPINANFGIMPPLDIKIKDKKTRYEKYVERAQKEMKEFSELLLH